MAETVSVEAVGGDQSEKARKIQGLLGETGGQGRPAGRGGSSRGLRCFHTIGFF